MKFAFLQFSASVNCFCLWKSAKTYSLTFSFRHCILQNILEPKISVMALLYLFPVLMHTWFSHSQQWKDQYFFFVLLTEEWHQYIKQLPTTSFKYLTISNTNHHHHHQCSITRQKIEHQIPYLSSSGMGCVESKLSPYFLGGLMNERNNRESEQTALCRNVQLGGIYSV